MTQPHNPTSKPRVAVLIPQEKRALVFSQQVEAAPQVFADADIATDDELANGDLSEMLRDVPAMITGWLSPEIPRSALAPQGSISFLSHTAGSVRKLGVQDAVEAGGVRASAIRHQPLPMQWPNSP